MNLNQITTRIGELSAELLTLHNDLAYLVEGAVTRQATGTVITHWSQLKSGDRVHVSAEFSDCGDQEHPAGVYEVDRVEAEDYTSSYQISFDGLWLSFTRMAANATITKVN
jgi:hypothetical protein